MEGTFTNSKKFCKCGCGLPLISKYGYSPRFLIGHNTRLRTPEQHWNWQGGKQNNNGYIMRKAPNHHFADANGYVREHRLVYEKYYKCCLLPWSVVHHKNETRSDNRIQNLEAVSSNAKHKEQFHRIDVSKRRCCLCGNQTVICYPDKKHPNYPHYYWFRDFKDARKWNCNKCHLRIIRLNDH